MMYIRHGDAFFNLANSEDPDEMPHYAAFYLELRCLPRYLYLFADIKNEKCQHTVNT